MSSGIPTPSLQFLGLSRGRAVHLGAVAVGVARLPTDSIGTVSLTLTNVVTGSRFRVERISDGSLAEPSANAEGTAAGSTVALSLSVYASGNSNNDLIIKVRKGTAAPKYQPFQTQATLTSAAQSIFIAQVPDPIA